MFAAACLASELSNAAAACAFLAWLLRLFLLELALFSHQILVARAS
jgi:hypothetical protein